MEPDNNQMQLQMERKEQEPRQKRPTIFFISALGCLPECMGQCLTFIPPTLPAPLQGMIHGGSQEKRGWGKSVTEPNLGPPTMKQNQSTDCLMKKQFSREPIAGIQSRKTGSSCSKDPDSQMAFRGGFIKATFAVRVAVYGLASDWLMVR